MSAKITERLRAALAQVIKDSVADELDACQDLLNERIYGASKDVSDHKDDAIEVHRELMGYARGLRDAASILRDRRKP